jgi:hypothetical protein
MELEALRTRTRAAPRSRAMRLASVIGIVALAPALAAASPRRLKLNEPRGRAVGCRARAAARKWSEPGRRRVTISDSRSASRAGSSCVGA